MSDLYAIRVEGRREVSIDEAVADAATHQMNPAAVRRVLMRTGGPAVVADVVVTAEHPDADALDAPSFGLVHFLLADTSEPLTEALDWSARVDKQSFYPGRVGSPIAYACRETGKKRLVLRLWCPASLAPDEGSYASAAWMIDRGQYFHLKPPPGMRCFPPPGLAGDLPRNKFGFVAYDNVSAFPWLKRAKVAAFVQRGERIYGVARKGGHVSVLEPPYTQAVRVGEAPEEYAKVAFTGIAVDGDALIIWTSDGDAFAVDPETGAVTPADKPEIAPDAALRARCGEIAASIDNKGVLTVETPDGPTKLATGIKRPRALVRTADPDDWIVVAKNRTVIVHVPTQTVSDGLNGEHPDATWIEREGLFVFHWVSNYGVQRFEPAPVERLSRQP